jgi:hypothetical protein
MKKIILALLILASIYALSVWGQNPETAQEALTVNETIATEQENASVTLGGFLILFSIAVGYTARRIYAFRSSYED